MKYEIHYIYVISDINNIWEGWNFIRVMHAVEVKLVLITIKSLQF